MTRTLAALIAAIMLLTAVAANPQTTAKKLAKRPTPAPVPPLVLPPAGAEQVDAAALALTGNYDCEFKQSLRVSPHPRFDSYMEVQFGKQTFITKPVLSSTGVLRLEDVRGRILLLQIAVKSMLMDVQLGQRLVDDCVTEKQLQKRLALAVEPALPGLGIAPVNPAARADGAEAVAVDVASAPVADAAASAAAAQAPSAAASAAPAPTAEASAAPTASSAPAAPASAPPTAVQATASAPPSASQD